MDNSDKKKPQGESKPAPASDETARPSMDKKAKEGAVEPSPPDSDVPGGTMGSR